MAEAKYRSSCDACLGAKIKCTREKPACLRCNERGRECVYSQYRKIGRPSYKTPLSSGEPSETVQISPSPSVWASRPLPDPSAPPISPSCQRQPDPIQSPISVVSNTGGADGLSHSMGENEAAWPGPFMDSQSMPDPAMATSHYLHFGGIAGDLSPTSLTAPLGNTNWSTIGGLPIGYPTQMADMGQPYLGDTLDPQDLDFHHLAMPTLFPTADDFGYDPGPVGSAINASFTTWEQQDAEVSGSPQNSKQKSDQG
ncbi:hypothetical protein F5B22DRAFT_618706 [Xylaria bambusicola]|uniref:uncharacterized protein n=1 Tax=Xylaria bambusicola TaxID=326684 RepID=UPI002008B6EA|nr:uncharacterized protein F5B22DRAFT_618706 [Xylaria bambusicola]KAI0508955.1 hypothetical protein F5B22DRAFT_618706 [Xylaria bambusicola]